MFDDIDDIWRMMDEIFDRNTPVSKSHHSRRQHRYLDRIVDKEHIYYTGEFRDKQKEDIQVLVRNGNLCVEVVNEDDYIEFIPLPIIKDKTDVSFVNGILDVILTINKRNTDEDKGDVNS